MRFPSEPFKIKVVEPIRRTTRANIEHQGVQALDVAIKEAYAAPVLRHFTARFAEHQEQSLLHAAS